MPACHAGGRRFEPVPGRHFFIIPVLVVGVVKRLRPRVVAPVYVGSNPTIHPILYRAGTYDDAGVSPSGKAMDSDSIMRRFESCHPDQQKPLRSDLKGFFLSKKGPFGPLRVYP